MTSPTYIGADVAKAEVVVATATAVLGTFTNDRGGHRALVDRLRGMTLAAVVIESTGCYHRELAIALSAAGLPVAIVQPGCVRHYAKGMGQLAKSDAIDARMIARFGAEREPRLWTMPQAETAHLRALVDRRDQVVEMRTSEQNRLEACADPFIARDLRRSIARLEKAVCALDATIAAHIAAHEPLKRVSEALQTEAGVGAQTAAVLLAHLPELGHINRQRVAALVGFAPYVHESGQRKGTVGIVGGRRRLRRALYMAAISAARWNHWIAPLYRRLRERGKPAKVALVACGRKLVIRLNTIAARTHANTQPA